MTVHFIDAWTGEYLIARAPSKDNSKMEVFWTEKQFLNLFL